MVCYMCVVGMQDKLLIVLVESGRDYLYYVDPSYGFQLLSEGNYEEAHLITDLGAIEYRSGDPVFSII